MAPLFDRGDGSVRSLDGNWDFTLLGRPGGSAVAQAVVEVPGCWTMLDVGDIPRYTNIQMPFAGIEPPGVPESNPTGVYRRSVEIPSEWADRRIVLHVGGAETVLYVAVDDVAVGMGTDSRLPHEFDLTPYVTPGQSSVLELTVVRWGSATWLEDQDHWHHAGLHRSVLLYATPPTRIDDVQVTADWDPSTGHGCLDVDVTVGGPAIAGGAIRVRYDGAVVAEEPVDWPNPDEVFLNAYLFERRGAKLHVDVGEVAPWSAEHPRLHEVRVELVTAAGEIDTVGLRSGFRRVEVVGAELLINGRAVLIKGVNRHDHDTRRGKAVTHEGIRRDIELMKAHHFNAVRTSHYPNDPYLYDVCDELGMYVVDEADIETHVYLRSLTKSPEWGPAILERITRMARRDVNHPCVIAWSLGNESGPAPIFTAAAAWLHDFDPSRPVQYEGGYLQGLFDGRSTPQAWAIQRADSDIVPPMYPEFADLQAWATDSESPPTRPLIMCEYAHAMGNSCGDLDRYWELIRAHHGLQGGFIWDWVDQALVQRLDDGSERLAYGGDFGDVPNDGVFCMNGLVAADRTPHPSLLEAAAVLQPVRVAWLDDDRVAITNEYDFTDLVDVGEDTWQVTIDGDALETGTLGRLAAAPGETIEVSLPLSPIEVDGWQIAHVTVRIGDDIVGQHEVGRSQVRTPLDAGVELPTRLSLWRAPIDNERFGPDHRRRWGELGLPDADERVELRTEREGALVTHTVTVPDEWDDIPRVGVRLELPGDVASIEWVGRGPHECYSDRRASAPVGRWSCSVDDWPTPYVHPQANGNRTDVRSVCFRDAAGEVVLVVDELEDLDVTVSRWTDEELDAAGHLDELPARNHAYLWIDAAHRGVGSAAVGPDVSEPHRIHPGTYRWSYRIHRSASPRNP